MAVPREKVLISAAGKEGNDAIQYWGHRDNIAQFGRAGAHGRSATDPTAGTDGRDISVHLSYSSADHAVLVEGTKGWKGPENNQTRWLVSEDQILLLDCRGGDGGKGGNGEDGQQGGQGARGRDATKHRPAEDGYPGARGGDGGRGTNGANGGKAGRVLITVNEDDLDLLLPVHWDIRGGKGGQSGAHGDPGDGGEGGKGGNGGVWIEQHVNSDDVRIERPPGRPGMQGPPGGRPGTYLQGGVGGAQGSSQVTVKRNNGTEATYPTRYELKVVSFDIVDENEDGINEPGEHLLVKNIRVQNTGGMPSPKNHDIQVLIHGTHHLEPIASEPVILPKDIQVDETILVPGVLRAFIMQERVPRAPGQKFLGTDEVQLIATMGRINRVIPEFKGSKKIEIKYPLELDAPKFLDCISPGDNITFSWTLRNISTKPYGIQGMLRRSVATCLTDPGHLFHFLEAGGTNANQMMDPLNELGPGLEVPISQTFKVSDMAFPYSSGTLSVELLLSEPGLDENRFSEVGIHEYQGEKLRSVMTYPMEMQISGVYSYNPASLFLLVVNSQTPNSSIHQIIDFIRNQLFLQLDIFNLSVRGSFIDPATNRNVVTSYVGKSIILCGNKFPYFGIGTSSAFELLDPWLTCQLAARGTNFHIASAVDNFESMRTWAFMSTFPVYPIEESNTSKSVHTETLEELMAIFHSTASGVAQSTPLIHSVASKKSLFGSLDSSLASATQKTAKKLNEQFPLRKFAVIGDPSSRRDNIAGRVLIREGFPKTASLSVSLLNYNADDGELHEYQKYLIISTLPFHIRSSMYWNMAGILDAGGVDSLTILKGPLQQYKIPASGTRFFTEKTCQAICLSIEYDLGKELGRYNSKAPYFDSIPREHTLRQLPLLTRFFDMELPFEPIHSLERTEFIIQTLGIIQGSLLPLGFLEGFRRMITPCVDRKGGLNAQVDARMDEFLSRRFAPDVKEYLKAGSTREGKATKRAMKKVPSCADSTSVTLSRVGTLVDIEDPAFGDLTGINSSSVAWTKAVADEKVAEYRNHSNTIQQQETQSRLVLMEMVEKIVPEG